MSIDELGFAFVGAMSGLALASFVLMSNREVSVRLISKILDYLKERKWR